MNSEQRQSFRIRIPEELEHAVLRVGGKTVEVRLVDESAGGFSIAIDHKVKAAPGNILRLRTAAGWHEVRVIHVLACDEGVLLGLVRLKDLEDPRHASPQSASRTPLGSFACIGFGIVVLIFVVNSLTRYVPARGANAGVSNTDAILKTVTEQVRKTQLSWQQMAKTSVETTTPSPTLSQTEAN